jgi:hypothetical protein
MSGNIPPLPQYAFMAWCSVKAQEQLYLLLIQEKITQEDHVKKCLGKYIVEM